MTAHLWALWAGTCIACYVLGSLIDSLRRRVDNHDRRLTELEAWTRKNGEAGE